MSVLLYNPTSSSGKKAVLPLSLLALGAQLEGQVDYAILDGNLLESPVEELSARIVREDIRILAVTVMPGPQLQEAVPLCRELVRRHPDLIIVWGGYFPSQHPDTCLNAPFVHHVVRGHADTVFLPLIEGLLRGDESVAHPGVASDPAAPSTVAPLPVVDDLPDFPYHRVDVERYVRPTFMGRRTLSHHSSYGCPFFCNFCAVVNLVQGGWRAQSAERTANVVDRFVREWNVDSVEFWDNNFFVHQARVAEFSERIKHHGLGWWGEGRVDTMLKYRESTWKAMSESGLRMVFLGAESGSDETLQRMDKGGTASTEKTLEIVAKMKEYDIVPELSFVLGNPPDPAGDAHATLEFIRTVKAVNPESEIILYLYTPVPLAGELFERARASGFAFPETLEGWIDPAWQDIVQRRSGHLPWIGDPIHRRVRDFERVINAFYPTVTDTSMRGVRRQILRGLASWRYKLRIYAFPYELALLQRLLRYQRPETASF